MKMSRIGPATVLLGFVAVLCGLLGAYAVRQALRPRVEQAAAPTEDRVVVPLASTDLKPGRKITLGDIVIQRVPRGDLKRRGISGAFMNNTRQIIGRVLNTSVPRGSTFDTEMFYAEGTGPGIERQLQPGFRAVTVQVESEDAVLGFAPPGSWVDVLFRNESNSSEERPEMTVTLLERVQIMAFGTDTLQATKRDESRGSRRSQVAVTLAVSPEQVAALRVCQGRGILSLALRHPDDAAPASVETPKTMADVFGETASNEQHMEVYRGRRFSNVMFSNDGKQRQDRTGRNPEESEGPADKPATRTAFAG